jgi:hypothetical protein
MDEVSVKVSVVLYVDIVRIDPILKIVTSPFPGTGIVDFLKKIVGK